MGDATLEFRVLSREKSVGIQGGDVKDVVPQHHHLNINCVILHNSHRFRCDYWGPCYNYHYYYYYYYFYNKMANNIHLYQVKPLNLINF